VHKSIVVSARMDHESLNLRDPEPRALGRLADLVEVVVSHLETTSDQPAPGAVAECNAALEVCLEARRDAPGRGSVRAARDELRRLARLLKVVEHPDSVLVLRQIRRVLGRFDSCGA
jgi:hypothetical protein